MVRPESIHRREAAGWERERVRALAAVEWVAIVLPAGERIHRFLGAVAVDTGLRCRRTQQPVAPVEVTIAERRANLPAIDLHAERGDLLFHLLLAFLHAQADLDLVRDGQILELEGLAEADTDTSQLGADLALFRSGGRELEREVEVLEEVRLRQLLVDLGKRDGRGCRRSGLAQILR